MSAVTIDGAWARWKMKMELNELVTEVAVSATLRRGNDAVPVFEAIFKGRSLSRVG